MHPSLPQSRERLLGRGGQRRRSEGGGGSPLPPSLLLRAQGRTDLQATRGSSAPGACGREGVLGLLPRPLPRPSASRAQPQPTGLYKEVINFSVCLKCSYGGISPDLGGGGPLNLDPGPGRGYTRGPALVGGRLLACVFADVRKTRNTLHAQRASPKRWSSPSPPRI
jgi:hypothetical protein